MKRLRVILLFLMLGTIVNVAVAWGIALTLTIKNTSNDVAINTTVTSSTYWELLRMEAFGTHFYMSSRAKAHSEEEDVSRRKEYYSTTQLGIVKPAWGSMDEMTELFRSLPGPPGNPIVVEIRMYEARGWPMRSLWCLRSIYVEDGTGVIKWFSPRGLIATPILPDEYWGPRVLPLYPIWIGFIANMLFYSGFLWLLLPGRRALRREIRRKRGLCMKCAYDLQGADHKACPECGAESPS